MFLAKSKLVEFALIFAQELATFKSHCLQNNLKAKVFYPFYGKLTKGIKSLPQTEIFECHLGCKDMGISKTEIVKKTHFLK